jgi:hypothetical protein
MILWGKRSFYADAIAARKKFCMESCSVEVYQNPVVASS